MGFNVIKSKHSPSTLGTTMETRQRSTDANVDVF